MQRPTQAYGYFQSYLTSAPSACWQVHLRMQRQPGSSPLLPQSFQALVRDCNKKPSKVPSSLWFITSAPTTHSHFLLPTS